VKRSPRVLAAIPAAALFLVLSAGVASAHSHTANGQLIANGQNHPRFIANGDGTFTSCLSYGPIPGSAIGPAWYGLETAHHGPDSGDAGKGDGCYMADASPLGEADDVNPAID
jgi:hypothetical protein